jgi:segregation and condensation protein B
VSGASPTRAVEALLFLSPSPLSVVELCELTGHAPGPVQRALEALAERHGPETGLEVAEVAGGYAMRTRADLVEVCDRLRARPDEERISPAALETLAVIAYLAPIGRPEIGRLRGVAVDSTVNSLLERGLIEEAGRPASGGAMRYRPTRLFQERFGLRHAGDLPPLERFELSGEEAERVRRQLIDAGHLALPGGAEAGEAGTMAGGDDDR